MITDLELDALFKRLSLANGRRVWRDLVQRAERETWTYRDFLTVLVTEEIAQRQQTRLARLSRRAHFPFLKTIDDFDFTYQSTVRLNVMGSALSPDFVTEGRSLVLIGKPGRGKTHLAVAIAYRAIQNGFDAVFTTAAAMIDELSAAFRQGRLTDALQTYTHPAVLVVDEVGYLTYGTDAANMLFHVVNDRHRRRRAMVFTTNKSVTSWGKVLHDEDLAQAIIDRVLERGRLLTLDGPSFRTKHLKLDAASPEASDQVIRISGIDRPEFPEPTTFDGDVRIFGKSLEAPSTLQSISCTQHPRGLICELSRLDPNQSAPFRISVATAMASLPRIDITGPNTLLVPLSELEPDTPWWRDETFVAGLTVTLVIFLSLMSWRWASRAQKDWERAQMAMTHAGTLTQESTKVFQKATEALLEANVKKLAEFERLHGRIRTE